MASEEKRGCGYRKVGGLYLRGGMISAPCDRLPYELGLCPVCGEGCQFSRSYKELNPLRRFGLHIDTSHCIDDENCFMCYPPDDTAYLMFVGEKHYKSPDIFSEEANRLGVSKRINSIPKKLVVGSTVIYLAHKKACMVTTKDYELITDLPMFQDPDEGKQTPLLDAPKVTMVPGIFSAFIPQAIEKLYWKSDIDNMSDEEKEKLKKKGITPIAIPDGDTDHA